MCLLFLYIVTVINWGPLRTYCLTSNRLWGAYCRREPSLSFHLLIYTPLLMYIGCIHFVLYIFSRITNQNTTPRLIRLILFGPTLSGPTLVRPALVIIKPTPEDLYPLWVVLVFVFGLIYYTRLPQLLDHTNLTLQVVSSVRAVPARPTPSVTSLTVIECIMPCYTIPNTPSCIIMPQRKLILMRFRLMSFLPSRECLIE